MSPPGGLEDTSFNFLEASQIHCGLLPGITNFNFSDLQMMANAHFLPRQGDFMYSLTLPRDASNSVCVK